MNGEGVNQAEATTTEELSFDEAGSDTEETSAEATGEQPGTEQTEEAKPADTAGKPEETAQPDFLKIKYNGAEETLTKEKAIEYAQKGRNYDKIMQRLNALENDTSRKVFEAQAQASGLTLEQYADRLQKLQQEIQIRNISSEFKKNNPDATDEIASQYARAQYQNQVNAMAQRQALAAQQAEQANQQRAASQVEAFMHEYPDVDIEKLPEEVVMDINQNGETLLSAYRSYENREMRKALDAERKRTANVKKATGRLNESVGTESADPFIDGLING